MIGYNKMFFFILCRNILQNEVAKQAFTSQGKKFICVYNLFTACPFLSTPFKMKINKNKLIKYAHSHFFLVHVWQNRLDGLEFIVCSRAWKLVLITILISCCDRLFFRPPCNNRNSLHSGPTYECKRSNITFKQTPFLPEDNN